MAKVTLQDLLAKQENKKKEVRVFESKALGGGLEYEKQTGWSVMKTLEGVEGSLTKGLKANCMLILDHCPLFQSQELQEKCGAAEPWEAVPIVFNQDLGEVAKLAAAIVAMYNLEEEAEDLKN